ncbi:MAG: class I SAM-dependent methyltransferase [Taibaiella sp.]|nr:class I SAM-dependent methyltransferase [Taibaiella sp.]
MNAHYLNTILEYIKAKNPMHFKKLKKNIAFDNEQYVTRAEAFFGSYVESLERDGKDLPFALDCYLKVCNDVMFEQMRFAETGAYTSTSFDEVNQRVYNNPEVMSYYMHGLLVSQYLWEHHYRILEFFFNNMGRFTEQIRHVLEVGGGHGLYTNEVIAHLNADYHYTMVDISETSIEMSKTFVKSDKVDYILQDVYQYSTEKKFDFIIMGEVLEHVEDPLGLMKKLHSLGAENATAFITAPCNSPAIDHIYLFRNPEELKALYNEAGWEVALDLIASSESKKDVAIDDPLVPVMYAAFLKKK